MKQFKESRKMSNYKRFLLLGSTLFTAVLLLIGPMASPAFAATRTSRTVAAPAAAINGCPPTLAIGSNSTWVQVLQYRLMAFYTMGNSNNTPHNYSPPLNPDGSFGSLTQAAVEDFQEAAAVPPDGVVGPRTWSALGFCAASNAFHLLRGEIFMVGNAQCPPFLGEGGNNNTTWVMALQSRLNIDYYKGFFVISGQSYLVVDGGFGSLTKRAVTNFQGGYIANRIPDVILNGFVDQQTDRKSVV